MRLAVDANVLLSIALGGAAARLVTRPDFELFTTPHTLDETLEYLPILAARKGLRLERMERALHAVPYESSPRNSMHREEAQRRIGARDPDDIDLAMHLQLTVWTNDRDFEISGLPVVSTAQLLAQYRLIP